MLKMPVSLQPCSSSPMSRRSGSALSVAFASPRQPKEECGVALLAEVRRTVHRENALLRQKVVHHREHRFFDFTGVVRADRDYQLLRKADGEAHFAVGVIAFFVRVEVASVEDGPFRREVLQLFRESAAGNRHRAKSECQAFSVTTRIGTRCTGSAPDKAIEDK